MHYTLLKHETHEMSKPHIGVGA